ncbi:hypothetical protein NDU88_003881 [Pleurodeles waltl]|uniref:RGS domain-containing protein n=2 Tax=Pleurodeles waltl TaxID=8319 RepID=A0AAV7T6K6_PLEWA|nr:hypothetical protein NDU88_003881 [Pleurodeles waltl]
MTKGAGSARFQHRNIKVFGQTPFYFFGTRQWILYPRLPRSMVAQCSGLMAWLEEKRFKLFCTTDLCLHYILCRELLQNLSSVCKEKKLRWQKADVWLLKRCIGSVRGIQRFRSFMEGTAGEELMDFWLSTERILDIDESDVTQRDFYLSLLRTLKATHLLQGSTVLATCSISSESLQQLVSWHPPGASRRGILQEIQTMAFSKLQDYWLRAFLTYCKLNLGRLLEGQGIMKEYRNRLTQDAMEISPTLPDMSIADCPSGSENYSSKVARTQLWQSLISDLQIGNIGKGSKETVVPLAVVLGTWLKQIKPEVITYQNQRRIHLQGNMKGSPKAPLTVACPTTIIKRSLEWKTSVPSKRKSNGAFFRAIPMFSLDESMDSCNPVPHFYTTPLSNPFSLLALHNLLGKSKGYLHWVLSADLCAGGPLKHFLRSIGKPIENHLLALWHDLEMFLPVLLISRDGGHFLLRQVLCVRLSELYLEDCKSEKLPISERTISHLQDLICSGEAAPWILQAQTEIGELLASFYDRFLEAEDNEFLEYVESRLEKTELGPKSSKEAQDLGDAKPLSFSDRSEVDRTVILCEDNEDQLMSRLGHALVLAQACCSWSEAMPLLDEDWKVLVEQDPQKGGSIQLPPQKIIRTIDYSKMSFEELVLKNPKLAIERLSSNFRLFYMTQQANVMKAKSESKAVRWKSASKMDATQDKPRSISDILHDPALLEAFSKHLAEIGAGAPLRFALAVEDLKSVEDPDLLRAGINSIVNEYFKSEEDPEVLLRTVASIIRKIPVMSSVSLNDVVLAQQAVSRTLNELCCGSEAGSKDHLDGNVSDTSIDASQSRKVLGSQTDAPSSKRRTYGRRGSKFSKRRSDRRRSSSIRDSSTEFGEYQDQHLRPRKRRALDSLFDFIRSVVKFRRDMKNPVIRREFEEFLLLQMTIEKSNQRASAGTLSLRSSGTSSRQTGFHAGHRSGKEHLQEAETPPLKRRHIGSRTIVLNYLIYDLFFYLEIEK